MKRLALLTTVALTVSACSEASSPTAAPAEMSVVSHKPTLNARGSGHFGHKPQRTFTFNARNSADGSTTGEYNLSIGGLVKIHGDVTCMTGNGDGQVWVGAVVTGGDTWPKGARVAFTVKDNGKAPDSISYVYWDSSNPAFDQLVCDVQPSTFLMVPVERGNITVSG